jgi:DNA mismatch repair protein MutS
VGEKEDVYCLAVWQGKAERYGLAYADLSTRELSFTELESLEDLQLEIARVGAREILSAQEFLKFENQFVTRVSESVLDEGYIRGSLGLKHISDLDLTSDSPGIVAIQILLKYLEKTQKKSIGTLICKRYDITGDMILDATTIRNLELVKNIHEGSQNNTLLQCLDRTQTAMGGRLLKKWILRPLREVKKIQQRLDAVRVLQKPSERQELSVLLKQLYDIPRLVSRVIGDTANGRDLNALKNTLKPLPAIQKIIEMLKAEQPSNIYFESERYKDFEALTVLIEQHITDEPPITIKEGGLIRPEINQELQNLALLSRGATQWLQDFETKLKNQLQIPKLKVGYSSVYGYYIEVSKINQDRVPADFVRRQTLTNAERYINEELKNKEQEILSASEKLCRKEYEIFCELREQVKLHSLNLLKISEQIAALDILVAFAEQAVEYRYCEPQFTNKSTGDDKVLIGDGRHPVVERLIDGNQFISNSLVMSNQHPFILLTGPNMAGKSTYMRQSALLILMAQIGSFVPAQEMIITEPCDRIFTRVGASDDLASGCSTFMMEMVETASILKKATQSSFVLLDEIGRGTSTYDGISIAWSVSEYLIKRIKAKVIFATHYYELTNLAQTYPEVQNYCMSIEEQGDQIQFLRKVIPGKSNKSYGVHVAQLAGLPVDVIERAQALLKRFEHKQ